MEEGRNRRIAKNTVFLYIRMIFVMLVSLYTVRVVLNKLGAEDYGIYNLVGGVVVLFSFISNSSSAATQRYLNFALGEHDEESARQVFSASLLIHLAVSLLIVIFAETIGLLLVNTYLVIPKERMLSANLVYQLSIITTALNIIKIPYNATVIAYERMSFYAVLSVFECAGKLAVAMFLSIWTGDKLIFYGILIAALAFFMLLIFKWYANAKFAISHFVFTKDAHLYKELVSFSGWSLLSSVGSVCANQGLNMILNRFFGVLVNTAMGIANQVNSAVYQLISNFQIAFEPQITKSYASDEREYLLDLIFKTSKFSFFLLWFFVLPLALNAEFVLKLWLSDVPEYSVVFLRIILVYSLIDSIIGPLWMLSYAIGNIRNYQIVAFIFSLLTVPLAWGALCIGCPPYTILIVRCLHNVCFSIYRFFYLRHRISFPVFLFCRQILLPCLLVLLISLFVSCVVFLCLLENSALQFFVTCMVTVLINAFVMIFIGCNHHERVFAFQLVRKFTGRKG